MQLSRDARSANEFLNKCLLSTTHACSAGVGDGASSGGGTGAVQTPAEDGAAVKALHNFTIQAGGKYYLVEASWWQQWKVPPWISFFSAQTKSSAFVTMF